MQAGQDRLAQSRSLDGLDDVVDSSQQLHDAGMASENGHHLPVDSVKADPALRNVSQALSNNVHHEAGVSEALIASAAESSQAVTGS